MTNSQLKVLASKVMSQNKTFKRGISNQTVDEVVSALMLAAAESDRIAELEEEKLKNKIYWVDGIPENSYDSPEERINEVFEPDLIGKIITFDVAIHAKQESYKVCCYDDNDGFALEQVETLKVGV